jgi:hypothetical protein
MGSVVSVYYMAAPGKRSRRAILYFRDRHVSTATLLCTMHRKYMLHMNPACFTVKQDGTREVNPSILRSGPGHCVHVVPDSVFAVL